MFFIGSCLKNTVKPNPTYYFARLYTHLHPSIMVFHKNLRESWIFPRKEPISAPASFSNLYTYFQGNSLSKSSYRYMEI